MKIKIEYPGFPNDPGCECQIVEDTDAVKGTTAYTLTYEDFKELRYKLIDDGWGYMFYDGKKRVATLDYTQAEALHILIRAQQVIRGKLPAKYKLIQELEEI